MTHKTINFLKQKDKIMISLKNIQNNYYNKPIEPIIKDNTFIPGLNGFKINIDKSYNRLKKVGSFNKQLLVYDTIKTKELIIKKCKELNIKFITCCGTGNKLHPELLEITYLDKTDYDPIARRLRKYVKDNKIKGKIMVVSSKEQGVVKSVNTIPSISFVPATAGILLASYVINDIIKGD